MSCITAVSQEPFRASALPPVKLVAVWCICTLFCFCPGIKLPYVMQADVQALAEALPAEKTVRNCWLRYEKLLNSSGIERLREFTDCWERWTNFTGV